MQLNQPRSLGMVLRSIREKSFGLTQHEMFDKLCEEPSLFALPPPIQGLFDESETHHAAKLNTRKRRGDVVSGWERSEVHVPFPLQMRYASLIGIRNGILHVASAYYADAREFCDLSNSKEKRDEYLRKAKRNLGQIRAFADTFELLLLLLEEQQLDEGIKKTLQNDKGKPERRDEHLEFIMAMVRAYKTGERQASR